MVLNNLQWLICHKTKPNHIYISIYIQDMLKKYFLLTKTEMSINFLQNSSLGIPHSYSSEFSIG